MPRIFCTITTESHLFKVFALNHSLQSFGAIPLYVLVVDAQANSVFPIHLGITYLTLDDFKDESLAKRILKKYSKPDHIRWCLKPILMLYLLKSFEQVIYLDNDLFFYSGYDFLFEHLQTNNIVLSPHWRIIDPEWEQIWLITNFREGIYNAGFLGANQNAESVLKWWAKACLYRCERNFYYALFDDQKYLDIFPVLEPKTHILKHKGCNVAGWNIDDCHRTKINDEVTIDNSWPVVFMHYANATFYELKQGKDPLLESYFACYIETLKHFKPDYDWVKEVKPPSNIAWFRYFRWRFYEMFNRK